MNVDFKLRKSAPLGIKPDKHYDLPSSIRKLIIMVEESVPSLCRETRHFAQKLADGQFEYRFHTVRDRHIGMMCWRHGTCRHHEIFEFKELRGTLETATKVVATTIMREYDENTSRKTVESEDRLWEYLCREEGLKLREIRRIMMNVEYLSCMCSK